MKQQCLTCHYWRLEEDPGTFGRCAWVDHYSMPSPLEYELSQLELDGSTDWPTTRPQQGTTCGCWAELEEQAK